MSKPTECVRAMLKGFGIHWWAGESEDQTRWKSSGLTWNFEEVDELAFLWACENDVTPEQAIAATLRECTYEQWRAINEIVGNAMEYAHDVAIMHPDKADPCWDLSNYVDQILEVAFGEHEAKLDAATVRGEANVRGD